jgi:hypothetical protein
MGNCGRVKGGYRMTYKYAWKVLKAQLQKTPQNVEIFAKIDPLIEQFGDLHEGFVEAFGTEAAHLLNHMRKKYRADLEFYLELEVKNK